MPFLLLLFAMQFSLQTLRWRPFLCLQCQPNNLLGLFLL